HRQQRAPPPSLHDALPIWAAPPLCWRNQRATCACFKAGTRRVPSETEAVGGRLAVPRVTGRGEARDRRRVAALRHVDAHGDPPGDRKSTRLNSSHLGISYA